MNFFLKVVEIQLIRDRRGDSVAFDLLETGVNSILRVRR